MVDIWFSSDLHLGHANILNFRVECRECKGTQFVGDNLCPSCDGEGKEPLRKFATLDQMHEEIITKHNQLVKPGDHWYNLGDITMMRQLGQIDKLLSRMNGKKRLILGNHDMAKSKEYAERFEKVLSYRVLDNVMFSHIPIHPLSMGRFDGNVHGHTHEQDNFPPVKHKVMKWNGGPVKEEVDMVSPYLNISVERTGYAPVPLEWIKQELGRLRKEA